MQKKLIALAVLAAISAPAFADTANVTVYGRAHLSLDSNSGNAPAGATTGTKNGLNLTTNASRLGFKGAEELSDGLKAVYQYETEVSLTGNTSTTAPVGYAGIFTAQRDTYIGVVGGFGTVVAGRLPLANQYVGDANFFADKVGDAGNLTSGGLGGLGLLAVPSRVSRAIGYVSPSFGGVTITVGYVPNSPQSLGGIQNNKDKASSFTLRAAYDNNGIFAAVNYLNLGVTGISLAAAPTIAAPSATAGTTAAPVASQSGAKVTILSLAGGYDFGSIAKVRAQIVNTDANAQAGWSVGVTSAKQTVFTVGGQFNVTEAGAIKAQVARAQDAKLSGATVANSSATMYSVGYDHNLSKRTTVYAAYSKVSNGSAAQFSATNYAHGGVGTPGVGNDPSALSVGMIHNF